jgi:AraC family transcriptional activator of pyochelin receptor
MIQTFQGTQSYRLTAADAEQQGNIRVLPATVGDCRSRFCPLADGFTVVSSDYHPLRPLIEETINPHDCPMLVLTFGLAGHSAFHGRDGSEAMFSAGQLTVTSFHGSRGERRYRAGEQVGQLRLLLSADSVSRYLGQTVSSRLFATVSVVNHVFTPYSRATTLLLQQLKQEGDDPLMQHINALNLLAQQRHLLEEVRERPLHPRDDLQLEQARDWMLAHLHEPFSLSTLAMAVGLSDYKLKQGFNQRFNTTPGQMLLQMRMEKAHQLLEQGYQVAQAGWQVGYRHANNFSVAFQRYFGRQPSAVAGKRQKIICGNASH